MIVIYLFVILLILYVLSTMCSVRSNGERTVCRTNYAHRGLHGDGVPENSLAAFLKAKEAGYGIELDVHLTKDGELAVIHDSSLKRVTGVDLCIEDISSSDLNNYCLNGSKEMIPDFRHVLEIVGDAVPLIVELKCVRDNYRELCQKTCDLLDAFDGVYCVESFDPRCVYWFRKNRPDIVRGQLTENYFVSPGNKLPWYIKFALRNQMLNFLTQPDFIAYRFVDRKTVSNTICKYLWKAQFVSWTLKNQDEYDAATCEGWIPIFENFRP